MKPRTAVVAAIFVSASIGCSADPDVEPSGTSESSVTDGPERDHDAVCVELTSEEDCLENLCSWFETPEGGQCASFGPSTGSGDPSGGGSHWKRKLKGPPKLKLPVLPPRP